MMKVLILGGVAAGTKVAAKLKRENRDFQVTVVTKSKDISYAGCGLPYYVGDVIQDKAQLIVNTPQKFSNLTGAEVITQTEAVSLNPETKTVHAVHLADGTEEDYTYDKLVIATGAEPVKPAIEGIDLPGVYYMRTPADAIAVKEAVEAGTIKRAVVVGGGFIGLEMAENLQKQGVRATVIEMMPHILPMYDDEICEYLENHLADQGIMTFTGDRLVSILGDGKVEKIKTEKRAMKADAVIMSVGIRPCTQWLEGTGLDMVKGTIKVNEYLETNLPDVYAVGDCACVMNHLTHQDAWSPMGSSANMEGRLAARNIAGGHYAYQGVLGTAVIKLPKINAGRTGLTEKDAKAKGYDPISVITVVDDKAHYYPGAGIFIVKMIADRNTEKLLGLQVLGAGAVDKMVDIAVTAITLGATLSQLEDMDLAYAPPFSTAIHPFAHTLNVLRNKLLGRFETFTPAEYQAGAAEDYKVLDVSLAPSVPGAPYLDLVDINGPVDGFGLDEKILLVCNRGKRAYLTQNRLKYYGYTNTKVLEGGTIFNTQITEEQ
jgi:NADPH-dependent 2,4-dienoyl-CoA reductase/sulfur reductase-like enzyme/rhodanese-related sulfurtransferase